MTEQTLDRCPDCGCNGYAVASVRMSRGRLIETRICDHCGADRETAVEAAPPPVWFIPVRCPICGTADQVSTTSTARPIRRHKCAKCGSTFKSVEREPDRGA